MKYIFILLSCLSCFAQDTRPRLEFEPAFNLNGGGFQVMSASISGGTGMEDTHFLWHVSGTYDTARKVDENPNNPHGNIRVLTGNLFGRTTGGWLFGTSGSYAQLRTTNYDKIGWGIAIGGGKDWMHATCPNCNGETSLRLVLLYGLPVHRGPEQEHGFQVRVTIPSPIETDRHVFFDAQGSAGWLNTNNGYTSDGSASFGVLFRF